MHPVKTDGKRDKTVLAVILALCLGMATPTQAYLLDFSVAPVKAGSLMVYAGGGPSGPLQVVSDPNAGDLGCQPSPPTPPDLLAFLDVHRRIANDTCVPGLGTGFASGSGAAAGATILTHLAPFSSTLLLLGCGLMGLAGLRYRRRRG